MEQVMLRNEKDAASRLQKDLEIKMKEIEVLRVKLQKEHMESVELFKSDFQRKFQDQDFEQHRRKL